MSCIRWLAFQGERDRPLDLDILDLTRCARTGQIDEAVEAMRQEASPPRRDVHAADTERAGIAAAGRSPLGTGEYDAGALGERLTDIAAAPERFEIGAFSRATLQKNWFRTRAIGTSVHTIPVRRNHHANCKRTSDSDH